MREEDVQVLISSIETLPLEPSDEFVARTRQRISDELQTTRGPEFSSIDADVDLHTTMVATFDEDSVNNRGVRNRLGVIAALVAACLAGIVAIQAVRTDDQPLVAEAADEADANEGRRIDVTGLEGDPEAATAFTVVEDAYAAHAGGDAVAWFAARFAGAEFSTDSDRQAEKGRLEANLAFGEEIKVSGCEFVGFGDWPLILDSGELASGYRFRCETFAADAILRAAGVGATHVIDWVVFEDRIIGAVVFEENLSDVISFDLEF